MKDNNVSTYKSLEVRGALDDVEQMKLQRETIIECLTAVYEVRDSKQADARSWR